MCTRISDKSEPAGGGFRTSAPARMRRAAGFGLLALALAGCGDGAADQSVLAEAEAEARARAAEGGAIDCIPAGAAALRRVCTIDRSRDADGTLILTVNHPDGSFRRLMVATDGRGVIAADGAEEAVVKVRGEGEIEVSIGGNLYRLPATVKPGT